MLVRSGIARRRPEPGDEIEVRCRCGQRDTWTRRHSDPPGALRAVTHGCPACQGRPATEVLYYDAAGRRVR